MKTKNFSNNSVKLLVAFATGIFVVIFCIFAFQLGKLNNHYSFSAFFPKNHPLLSQSQKVAQVFQLQERSYYVFMLNKDAGDWLQSSEMKRLGLITNKIKESSLAKSVFSLANIEGALDVKGALYVGPIFDSIPQKEWTSYIRNSRLIEGQLISKDLKSVAILVEPIASSHKDFAELRKYVVGILKSQAPDVAVEIAGAPEIQGRFTEILTKELKLFVALSFLAFLGLFGILIQGWRALAVVFVTLLLGNFIVLGVVAFLQIPFTVLLSTLPIILSVSIISVMIHTMHRWAEHIHENSESVVGWSFYRKVQESTAVLKEMIAGNFLGSVTTALGFLALYTAPIPLIKQYAWVVAAAVMVGFFISQVVLFVYMGFTRPTLRKWFQQKSTWTQYIFKYRHLVLGSCAFVLVGSLVLAKDMNFSTRLFDDLSPKDSARASTEKMDAVFGGSIAYDLILATPQTQFWKNPENLKRLATNVEFIRREKEVGSVLTVTDFLGKNLPQSKEALAETLFLFSMAESNPIKSFLTEDASRVRLAFRFYDLPGARIEKSQKRIREQLRQQFPQAKFEEGGLGYLSHTINNEVSKELVFGFWQSLLVIGALLAFVFRSMRWALLSCLPNLIPPAVLMGAMGFAGTPIKPSIAIIFSIALGLAFNNTVYLLTRLKRDLKDKQDRELPIETTMFQEGNPCLFETLIMFVGFVIFLASNFGANQMFGVYMILSIAAGAFGDLLVLPAVLKEFPELLLGHHRKEKIVESKVEIEKIAASFFIAFSLFFFAPEKTLALDKRAQEILQKVQKQIQSKDEQAQVTMKIIEPNGEIKTRSMKIQTLQGKKFYALVRILAPADIKGTAVLSEIDKQEENQWLYLPSTKQVRRVVNTKKSNGVLGSELSMDDLNSTAIKGSEVRLFQSDATYVSLEVVPKKGKSIYERVLTTISATQHVPVRTEYFQNGQVVKTVQFSNYKKVNDVLRAHSIKIRNQKSRRGTDLELTEVKINSGLKTTDFTVNALKE